MLGRTKLMARSNRGSLNVKRTSSLIKCQWRGGGASLDEHMEHHTKSSSGWHPFVTEAVVFVCTFYYDRFPLLSRNNCLSNCLLFNRGRLLKNDPVDHFSLGGKWNLADILFVDNSVDKLLKIFCISLKCHWGMNDFYVTKYYFKQEDFKGGFYFSNNIIWLYF